MNRSGRFLKGFITLLLFGFLAGCAVAPGPYYSVHDNPAYSGSSNGYLSLGPNDQYYVLRVEDSTPFGLHNLPNTDDMLYERGYDKVRREKEADFAIDVVLSGGLQDNPNQRAANTVGGALLGAAAGAIIGGAVGDPGPGAAIGAASGGALGLVAPAATPLVNVAIELYSFAEQRSSRMSRTIDLSTIPPQDARYVIDNEVARMLQTLSPRR